jgi:hypothetical protein
MADDRVSEMTLRWNEPLAVEITAAVQRGRADRVRQLIEKHPGLAQAWVAKMGRPPGRAACSTSLPTGPATVATQPRS